MLMLMFFEAFVVLLNILSSICVILFTNKSNCNSALSVGLSLISNQ